MYARRSRLCDWKRDRLIEHFVAGTTARAAAGLVGVHQNTSASFFTRPHKVIAEETEKASPFVGEIEVDESYFGGARKGKRGRSSSTRTAFRAMMPWTFRISTTFGSITRSGSSMSDTISTGLRTSGTRRSGICGASMASRNKEFTYSNLVRSQRDEIVAGFAVRAAIGLLTARDLELAVDVYNPELDYLNVRDAWFGLGINGKD